ncbi:MAG: heavy metal translocating P-type ATPase [Planctomycetota bacterium]
MTTPLNQSIEFQVGGMSCAACVGRIERAVKRIPGVSDISVNLATQRAVVRLASESVVSSEQIADAIIQSGYSALLVQKQSNPERTIDPSEELSNQELNSLGRDFWISLIFALPVFLISMLPMLWNPLMDRMMQWMPMQSWNWILWGLATVVQFWSARRFYRNAYHSLLDLSPDMNFLVAMGTTAAYTVSTLITFFPNWLGRIQQHVYFESSAVVICLVLLGKYLEARSKRTTRDALYGLAQLQPQMAHHLVNGVITPTPTSQINIGDRLVVFEGQSIPLDGRIIRGSSFVQEAMVTGEPIPKELTVGDRVIGGTLNGNGQLTIEVTAIGSDTFLARMTALVVDAQSKKPPIQSALDRIIRIFAPSVLVLAILTAIGWWTMSQESAFEKGLLHAVAILVVACPCALGLASPISMAVGSGRAAELGILFRSHESIEKLARIDSIVFDKTGTLTTGKPTLAGAFPLNHSICTSESELLRLASMAAKSSNHPIAIAIRDATKELRSLALVMETQAVPGKGIRVRLSDNRKLALGSYAWMKQQEFTNDNSDRLQHELSSQGYSISWLAVGNELAGALAVQDPIKPEGTQTIASLHQQGLKIAILSGDQSVAVEKVARELGVDRWHAEHSPEEKSSRIRDYKDAKEKVAFVGDGINDAPALAQADLGIAMGSGSEAAISSADVVLASSYLPQITLAIGLARSVMRNIYQNLFWAFAYNILLIPLAAGWLSPWTNWTLTPMLAALAMGLSSLLVVGNALRLRSYPGSRY